MTKILLYDYLISQQGLYLPQINPLFRISLKHFSVAVMARLVFEKYSSFPCI